MEALAQGSGSGGSSDGCFGITCRTPCERDHSKPPEKYKKEITSVKKCCSYTYHYYDENGVLVEETVTKFHQDRVCIDSYMLEYCFECKDGGNG